MIYIRGVATRLLVGVWVTLLAFTAAADEPRMIVQALAGRYTRHFQNGMVDGEKYWSDNVVKIVAVAEDAAYFRALLQFFNGHFCDISGIAKVERSELVYREPPSPSYPLPDPASWAGAHPCVLRLSRVGSKMQLDDGEGSCNRYCGARGMLTWSLPFSSKRPITYMSRLKASPDYIAAMAHFSADR